MSEENQYASRDIMALDEAGNHYIRHVDHMTREKLHSKSDIAAELGWRDMQIAELKAQRDALAAEVSAIRDQAENVYAAGYQHGHLNTVDGIAYAPPVKDEFYHNALQVMLEAETPATDAYLNSVRAEGVEALTKVLQVMTDAGDFAGDEVGAIAGAIDAGNYHAAKLRAGESSPTPPQ